jgi:hypothetical protein
MLTFFENIEIKWLPGKTEKPVKLLYRLLAVFDIVTSGPNGAKTNS